MKFNGQSAYRTTVCVAGGLTVVCPMLERRYALEVAAECVAFACIGTSLLAFVIAGLWIKRASVPNLLGATGLTIAVPFLAALVILLCQIQMNMHGVGFATFFLNVALSLLTILLFMISAGIKHIRAVNQGA